MKIHARSRCALLITVAALLLLLVAPASARRVVAIGDVHGAYDQLVELLQSLELIDSELQWIGGDDVLVQTGDLLDRGIAVFEVMDLFIQLQEQAAAAGGEVRVLMGNHEAMNILGFYRDVSPNLFARLAGEESQKRVDAAWEAYTRYRKTRSRQLGRGRPDLSRNHQDEWRSVIVPGYLEHQDALAPGSRYGDWLRSLPTVTKVDDSLFLHGGISPTYADWSIERINQETWSEIERLEACRARLLDQGMIVETSDPTDMVREGRDELASLEQRIDRAPASARDGLEKTLEVLERCVDFEDWFLVKDDSPIWFRGLARADEEESAKHLEVLLATHDVERIVIGHTPHEDREILSRFAGRVVVIDTGMLQSVYDGEPAALVIAEDSSVSAHYLDRVETLQSGTETPRASADEMFPWPGPDGSRLPFRSDEQVVEFLQSATINAEGRTEKGVNRPLRVRLEKDGVSVDAVFRSVDEVRQRHRSASGRFFRVFKDSYRFEPAAYELSRFLGLGSVPPAVTRSFRGDAGSVQLWVHGVFDEDHRRQEELDPPNPVAWVRQGTMRRVFDNLIGNFDRNQGNILIEKDSWRIWLIDHTRAFLEEDELLDPDKIGQCDRTFYRRLKEADPAEVRDLLGPHLTEYELKALLARWQKLVALLDEKIEQRSEQAVLFDLELPSSTASRAATG